MSKPQPSKKTGKLFAIVGWPAQVFTLKEIAAMRRNGTIGSRPATPATKAEIEEAKAFKRTKAASQSQAQKKSASWKTVKSDLEAVYKALGRDLENSFDTGEYTYEATRSFLEEWAKDELPDWQKENGESFDEVPTEVEDAVREKIEEEVSSDLWKHQVSWLESAIENAADNAIRSVGKRAEGAVGAISVENGQLNIDIAEPFVSIWKAAINGIGYTEATDEELGDIKTATAVISILDNIGEVYGGGSVARYYEKAIDDRYQPETGRYGELSKIAAAAMKKVKA